MNPILPRPFFIADGEAHVMPDGRLYLYGSTDISGKKEYCGHVYHVFSTEDETLTNWTYHGISFKNTKEEPGIYWSKGTPLYAPDAIHKDGKYYLYVCGQDNFEAVAVSDKPYGPFGDAKPVKGADGDSIDPAVFVDDDGQAYYLWGQFNLRGAKLNDDMSTLDMDSLQTAILTEQEHGFHEGACMRKRNGIYYIVYTDISRGKATCLSYAMSDKPLGPYKKGGVIIDNMYCDPQTWNNHGSIEEFKGQWYIFYHRSSQNSFTSRRMCVEKIYFNEDGTINEVKMTSMGAGGPIDAFKEIDASIACRVKGNIYIAPYFDSKEILVNCGGGNWIQDWAEYKYLDFKDGVRRFCIKTKGKGRILVKTNDNLLLAAVDVDSPEFEWFETDAVASAEGVKALWLMFEGREMKVFSFRFE